MAFSGNFLCTSFKKELLQGTHTFANSGGDQFKIALFTNSAEPTQGSFGGSGTTALVADRLNRNATVIELNKDYVDIAEKRIMGETPMFTKVSIE